MKKLEKNLANCTPREFLAQTVKIRKQAEKWLSLTDIMAIRKNVPKLDIPADATPEEAAAATEKFREAVKTQGYQNLLAIFDTLFEKNAEETLELLALLNFIEPKDIDKYKMSALLRNTADMFGDEDVISFFTSLMRLNRTGILST